MPVDHSLQCHLTVKKITTLAPPISRAAAPEGTTVDKDLIVGIADRKRGRI